MDEINKQNEIFSELDRRIMSRAIELAEKAYSLKEVPVGAVVVRNGEIISEGYNRRETDKNALCHAEIIAIDSACKKLGGWRLHECELYVTLEPCTMCAGAIINARIKRVIIGASDKRYGAFGGLCDMNTFGLNHRPIIEFGLYELECSTLMRDFFKQLRK